MVDITLDQEKLYPEVRVFDKVIVTPPTLQYLRATLYLRTEHCLGHFTHYPTLPLSEVGSLASRAAALHAQVLAKQTLPDLWAKQPIAVVAKYSPLELNYKDPAVQRGITIEVASRIEKVNKRLTKACVGLTGTDREGVVQVSQEFDFVLAFRLDLGTWRTESETDQ